MNTELYNKVKDYDFKSLFNKLGYAYFTKGSYNLNIIGIRSDQKNIVTNKFDDVLVVIYKNSNGWQRKIFSITTDPGLKTMLSPINKKGTAILAEGQYRGAYKLDKHNGKYKALCQRIKPVKVYRDNNKNKIYDFTPEIAEEGMFGINIHRSNETWTRETVDGYSAGCQVFNNPKEFKSFIYLCETAANLFGNSFTYTLLNENQL